MQSLQERLSELLQERVRLELPKVRKELTEKLAAAQDGLAELGEDMSSDTARRLLFAESSQLVKQTADAMITGNYNFNPAFFTDVKNRLRSNVRAMVEAFNVAMLKCNRPKTEYGVGDVVTAEVVFSTGVHELTISEVSYPDGKVQYEGVDKKNDSYCIKEIKGAAVPAHLQDIMRRVRTARGRELTGFLVAMKRFCLLLLFSKLFFFSVFRRLFDALGRRNRRMETSGDESARQGVCVAGSVS